MAIVSQYTIDGLDDVHVILVPSTKDALQRFAVSFYNSPSRKMLMVGVTGEQAVSKAFLIQKVSTEKNIEAIIFRFSSEATE